MRVNILFGSESDKKIFEPLCNQLRAINDVQVFFEVCSAHRNPGRLRKIILDEPCDLYITGAGLAAHLPGVVASQTNSPVIGIPCDDILKGSDALLSIIQMPKGVPALCAAVDGVKPVVDFVNYFAKNKSERPQLRLHAPSWAEKFVNQFKQPLQSIGWQFSDDKNALDIVLADLVEGKIDTAIKPAYLAAPVIQQTPFEGDLRQLTRLLSHGGLWVGINNITNLQIALLQMWNLGNKENDLLAELKGGVKQSVR